MWARGLVGLLVACSSKQPAPRAGATTCIQVGDHVLALFAQKDQRTLDIRTVFVERCEKEAWNAEVRSCIVGTKSFKDPRGCKTKLTAEQRMVLDANLAAAEERARDRPPAECVAYEQMMVRVEACKQLPPSSRDSLKKAFESSKATWQTTKRSSVAASCKAGADGTKQAVAKICKW
ncbi:MAG: hypothetical protein ABI867_12195 [Kofleriaceae bacterium]